jgi:hypothetical protein
MIFFFGNRKHRQFNYKPQYIKEEELEEKDDEISFRKPGLSDAMYDRWNRIPFDEVKKTNQKRTLYIMVVLVFILGLLVLNLERLEPWLSQFE